MPPEIADFPGAKELWDRLAPMGRRAGIKVVVFFTGRNQLGRVRVIVNGLDLIDLRQQLRIGSLRGCIARVQARQKAERNQKNFEHQATPH